MSQLMKEPTHHRLNIAFRALGPYLREEMYGDGVYLFDCLAVCVDDKKSPEHREFWGWWMELRLDEREFATYYSTGRFDLSGNWVDGELKIRLPLMKYVGPGMSFTRN
ncbi:sigma factor-binding protein Crl [Vibrio sp. PP-XX7]